MYDPELRHIAKNAFSRIVREMAKTSSFMEARTTGWIEHIYGASSEECFIQASSFPMLLLPWWLEKTYHDNPDTNFQTDLAYSTMNGYFFIRLIDNLMDGHGSVELKLLPLLNFFHTQFQIPYQIYFAYDHPFWDFFKAVWLHSAEVTMKDAELLDINRDQFMQITAQKTCAVKIPISAVCHRYGLLDVIKSWNEFVELFGCWHQMQDDLFDCFKDQRHKTNTYFLSEANRRKNADESVIEWIIREGFNWGMEVLQIWMNELKLICHKLNSPDMSAYLAERELMLMRKAEKANLDLQVLAKIGKHMI